MAKSNEREPKSRRKRPEKVSALATFQELLPVGFQLEAPTALVVAKEKQEVYQNRSGSLGEAIHRAQNISGGLPIKNGLARSIFSTAIALKEIDPLEQYRKKMGLDVRRDQLMNSLYRELSFETGFSLLNLGAAAIENTVYSDMADLNQKHPHLTRTDITLISLLNTPPGTFLTHGVTLDRPPETFEEAESVEVPIIAGASTQGLIVVPETSDVNVVSNRDIYGQHGITGESTTREMTPYSSEIQTTIDELVPLIMTNYRLHQRLWEGSDSAVMDGMSKIDRQAAEATLGERFGMDVPTPELIRSIPQEKQEEFRITQKKMESLLGRDLIIDLQTGQPLNNFEMVKLLGMIDSVPQLLFDPETPFEGFFMAYGPGIMFLDQTGKALDYSSYHPYYLRLGMQGLYTESVDVTKANRTAALIINDLSRQAEVTAMNVAEETGEDPSILEGLKIDLKLKYNIDLDLRPEIVLVDTDLDTARYQMGEKISIKPNVKFGAQEAKQLIELLELLPEELLKNVSRFKKASGYEFDFTELQNGVAVTADYSRDGTITIHQNPTLPYVHFTPEMKAARAFAIIHEVGHGLWQGLTQEQMEEWTAVSWDEEGKVKKKPREAFLTMYSHHLNSEEDFCDHFASFVLHAQEFRDKAKNQPTFREKYRQIKTIVQMLSGREVEYPQISPWSVEQINGAVDAQVKKLTTDEVIDRENVFLKGKEVEARGLERKLIVRTDKVEDILTDQEVEEIDPYASPQEKIRKDNELEFKSRKLRDFLSYFANYQPEKKATSNAKRLYRLLEKDEIEKALKLAASIVEDDDELDALISDMKEVAIILSSDDVGEKVIENQFRESVERVAGLMFTEMFRAEEE